MKLSACFYERDFHVSYVVAQLRSSGAVSRATHRTVLKDDRVGSRFGSSTTGAERQLPTQPGYRPSAAVGTAALDSKRKVDRPPLGAMNRPFGDATGRSASRPLRWPRVDCRRRAAHSCGCSSWLRPGVLMVGGHGFFKPAPAAQTWSQRSPSGGG